MHRTSATIFFVQLSATMKFCIYFVVDDGDGFVDMEGDFRNGRAGENLSG